MIIRLQKNISILFSRKYLLYTNVVVGSTFLVGGYSVADKLRCYINKSHKSSLTASKLKMLSILGAFYGTYQTFAYRYLDSIKLKRAVIVKLLLDQLILAPFSVSLFLFANEACDNNWDWKVGFNYTKISFGPIFLADMVYWLPLQYLNFRVVHPRFRYVYVAGASIVWNIILSFLHLEFQKNSYLKNIVATCFM